MVGGREHWNTMGGWGGDTIYVSTYCTYVDKYIIVTMVVSLDCYANLTWSVKTET